MKKILFIIGCLGVASLANATCVVNPLGIADKIVCVTVSAASSVPVSGLTGGSNNQVLYGNGSGTVVQSSDFGYTVTTKTFTIGTNQHTFTAGSNITTGTTRAGSSQSTNNLWEFQDSSANILSRIGSDGKGYFPSLTIGSSGTGAIDLTEGTVPSAPGAGSKTLYIDSTSHRLKTIDSSSVLTILADTSTAEAINNKTLNFGTDVVGTDTYALTLSPVLTTYTGACIDFIAGAANAGAASMNVNGLGAKTIVKVAGGITTTLADNDIRSGQRVHICYDGTNFQIMSLLGNAPSGGGGGGGVLPKEYLAAKCQSATAGAGMSLPAALAPAPVCITGTNVLSGELEFPDSDGLYYVQDRFKIDTTALATAINFNIKWRAAATSGDVVYHLQTICVADAETLDPSFNTEQTVTDTAKGTTLQVNDAQIATVTVTGCAAGETLFWKFGRDRTTSGDTITGIVKVLSVEFTN